MANFGTSMEADIYKIYFVFLLQLITLLEMLCCHINRASVYLVAKWYLLHSYNTIKHLSLNILWLKCSYFEGHKNCSFCTYPGFYDLLKYNFALYFWMLCFHYRHWGVGAYCDNVSIPCYTSQNLKCIEKPRKKPMFYGIVQCIPVG